MTLMHEGPAQADLKQQHEATHVAPQVEQPAENFVPPSEISPDIPSTTPQLQPAVRAAADFALTVATHPEVPDRSYYHRAERTAMQQKAVKERIAERIATLLPGDLRYSSAMLLSQEISPAGLRKLEERIRRRK